MSQAQLSFELSDEQLAASRILVVDDDQLITNTLRNFLLIELEVEAVTFNDPSTAVGYFEHHEVDLVISDFLMPGLDGIRLLGRAREHHPLAPRILLTGYADKENAIKAINEVQLYQYIEKPWDSGQLRNVIRNGVERKHLVTRLSSYIERLTSTEEDLVRLRTGLVRAFA
jgi:DNA-binding NtrC family response regulator